MKLIITGSLLFLLPFLALSQSSDLGNWYIYFGNKKINNSWNWHHEVQYRNYNFFGDLEQLLLRTGIGYNLSENNNNVLLGYGYVLSENYLAGSNEKAAVKEHRIYQQYITRQAFGRVQIQHRYRFEQRFVADKFKMRFRYFLSLNIPLNNNKVVPKTYYISAYNELFLNTKSVVFDRNRLYTGLGYKLNENLKMELGYMTQYFEKGSRDQLNIIAFLSF
ncbi:MAG: DUF2490 domain-containing protein [Lewinellaceae bacterium]|nr:DUF2490 domain-containing protein [Lewinellaceae bacterium]